MSPRILIVVKQTTLHRITNDDQQRLIAVGATTMARLEGADRQHQETVAAVHSACAGCQIRERGVGQASRHDVAWADLVITVGGDGTVFGVHPLLSDTPVLAVNSDPERSVGHFTRAQRDSVAVIIADWRQQRAGLQTIPRLQVRIADRSGSNDRTLEVIPVLNDCLFTNGNPAAMTRYLIQEQDGTCELHNSSGVWIATAAGSTAAIASAGCSERFESHEAVLLYRVREPFQAQHLRLVAGCQTPPRALRITAALPNMKLFIDGAHNAHPVPPGCCAEFSAHPQPLQLVTAATAP